MYTKEGWLSAKGVKYFLIIIIVFAILGTLSSCTKKKTVYYLQINDYCEETYCVNIVDQDDHIVVILDRNIDCHSNPQEIVKDLESQIGFISIFLASNAYWDLIKQE